MSCFYVYNGRDVLVTWLDLNDGLSDYYCLICSSCSQFLGWLGGVVMATSFAALLYEYGKRSIIRSRVKTNI